LLKMKSLVTTLKREDKGRKLRGGAQRHGIGGEERGKNNGRSGGKE